MGLREKALAVATLVVIVGVPVYQQLVRPMVDRWSSSRQEFHLRQMQHSKLQRNLQLRESAKARVEGLGQGAWQMESDEVTLSSFLGELEVLARRPTLRIASMNPGPVKDEGMYKVYPVRLTVSGRPMEVAQFVAALTAGQSVTSLRSFSLRGLQTGELIEATLNLWMVKLKEGPARGEPGAQVTGTWPRNEGIIHGG